MINAVAPIMKRQPMRATTRRNDLDDLVLSDVELKKNVMIYFSIRINANLNIHTFRYTIPLLSNELMDIRTTVPHGHSKNWHISYN